MYELRENIIKHELIEKFLDHKKLPQLFETLCKEISYKIKYLNKEEQETIIKSCEKLYKDKNAIKFNGDKKL